MKLTVPIYRLKRLAKTLSRQQHIPLNQALNQVAAQEGFSSWSLLAAKAAENTASIDLLAQSNPGDLVLLGARPGHGKTLLSLEILVEAIKSGRRGVFFTLEYSEEDLLARFKAIAGNSDEYFERFEFDTSDNINADYMMRVLRTAPSGMVVVVDYLQALDQKRENPELKVQLDVLKEFARERGLVIVFLSQIDRSYDPSINSVPSMQDVRLPNPIDPKLFNQAWFLNDGELQANAVP